VQSVNLAIPHRRRDPETNAGSCPGRDHARPPPHG